MVAAGLEWNYYYYVLLGLGCLNTVSLTIVFHPNFMREKKQVDAGELNSEPKLTESPTVTKLPVVVDMLPERPREKKRSPLLFVLTNGFCWCSASFMVLYLGIEISQGGWIVEFMIQVTSPIATLISGSRWSAV